MAHLIKKEKIEGYRNEVVNNLKDQRIKIYHPHIGRYQELENATTHSLEDEWVDSYINNKEYDACIIDNYLEFSKTPIETLQRLTKNIDITYLIIRTGSCGWNRKNGVTEENSTYGYYLNGHRCSVIHNNKDYWLWTSFWDYNLKDESVNSFIKSQSELNRYKNLPPAYSVSCESRFTKFLSLKDLSECFDILDVRTYWDKRHKHRLEFCLELAG